MRTLVHLLVLAVFLCAGKAWAHHARYFHTHPPQLYRYHVPSYHVPSYSGRYGARYDRFHRAHRRAMYNWIYDVPANRRGTGGIGTDPQAEAFWNWIYD